MLIIDLGNIIRERRKTLGITQAHLAELSQVNVNTIIRIENGNVSPTLQVVNQIAEILGMTLTLEVKNTNS